LGQRLGLAQEIDSRLQLLKRHRPYRESDHVLNLAYNALLDGQHLEDIELRRNDEAFLNGLGAQRIPDPTSSGDFTRRFDQDSLLTLMEAINATRQQVWEKQPGTQTIHSLDKSRSCTQRIGGERGGTRQGANRPFGAPYSTSEWKPGSGNFFKRAQQTELFPDVG
jgi:hypothetical protein